MENLKVSGKALKVALLQKAAQTELNPRAIAEGLVPRACLTQRLYHVSAFLVFGAELGDGFVACVTHGLHEVANTVPIHLIPALRFGRPFIALGYGHLTHV